MRYFLGIDVGSVNSKLSLIDENYNAVYLDTEKISSGPRSSVKSLISRLAESFDLKEIVGAGISGSGRMAISKELGWVEYSDSLAIASGLLRFHPDAKTIIQIGGQTSLIIGLEDGLRKPWKVASNPLCAAGTGRFLEQQAYRLGISMDDLSSLALKSEETPPRIAARCSVFAKTDLIHLQQKGVSVETMLRALCESVARMVASFRKGPFEEPIYLVGGVAANSAIAKMLSELISTRNGHETEVKIPENYLYIESLGTAMLSMDKTAHVTLLPEKDERERFFQMPKLEVVASKDGKLLQKIDKESIGYLGVDIGSTSTKAVILDEAGKKVIGKNYLMTAGRPIEAIKEVFKNLLKDGAGNVKIGGVGITGSGRYLVGSFIGADLVKNEITAQNRAAEDLDADADIIEIGGQDSKLVIKRNGVVIDYQMNKACAAGTGSFIDELAEMLGISVTNGEFASLAFKAPYTIDLGTRCAAFMSQAVASAQQQGMPLEIIVASLSTAIAKNYLSKVVGNRRLGDKVILTGAVFYNEAVVSAFHSQLGDRELIVPEHKEISGAIGAALLAKEQTKGEKSSFRGFQRVVDSKCTFTSFVCKNCDNNCTITRMQMSDEKATYYGSRCDRYDSDATHAKKKTLFDKREELLFREYNQDSGTGPSVGIPRALLVYDFAPLLIGFLNALDARCVLSPKTSKEVVEKALELSYADSCFPLKLLHGHTVMLEGTDYILFPSAIRLGEVKGDENQKYSCPLVQASPYIIRNVFNLEERLLTPTIDFSQGDGDVIKNLTEAAVKMGFGKKEGKAAAMKGIESLRRFETDQANLGKEILKEIHQGDKLGVVFFARSYMSQDAGANLGIAEKMAQLGVEPIPLDFLPLASINPHHYSDRPYWFYESKYIAGAALTVSDPKLFGLALTNFSCGPNSFILPMVEDIMGDKPFGQLEIDEHAAEAGIVTRIEAYIDTIKGFAYSVPDYKAPDIDIYRGVSLLEKSDKKFILPDMSVHVPLIAAAMRAYGVNAVTLPEANEQNILHADRVTSGVECLPYRITLGGFMRYYYENGHDTEEVEAFMAGAYGPCRFGKYAIEQIRIFKDLGINLPMRTATSNNAYRDVNLGLPFMRLAWKAGLTGDFMYKLLRRTRPYEREAGSTEVLFDEYTKKFSEHISKKKSLIALQRQATADFTALIDPEIQRRPVVGINGEIFLRSNRFSNNGLVKVCENAGLEVVVSSIGEWLKYIIFRHIEDAARYRDVKKLISGYLLKYMQDYDEHSIEKAFSQLIEEREPSISGIISKTEQWLSSKCGSEAVLSIGTGIEWMENPEIAGVISVMPHGCMPGGIVAAMSGRFSDLYGKPWINLTYDGFQETNNLDRINNFAEIIRFCSKGTVKTSK